MILKGIPFVYEKKDGDGRYSEDDDDKKVAAFGVSLSSKACFARVISLLAATAETFQASAAAHTYLINIIKMMLGI